jgi:hypothetical protein
MKEGLRFWETDTEMSVGLILQGNKTTSCKKEPPTRSSCKKDAEKHSLVNGTKVNTVRSISTIEGKLSGRTTQDDKSTRFI